MRSRTVRVILISLAALLTAACAGKPVRDKGLASGSGSSLSNAAATGTPVSAIVELSDMYRAPETYDAKITVLEIMRGEPAKDLLTKASASIVPAKNGFDYVLARIRFEYTARGAPGDKAWELTGKQFSAFSAAGKPYQIPSIVPPEPGLDGALRPGNSRQGWVAFEVAKDDPKPVMTFSLGSIWFQLY